MKNGTISIELAIWLGIAAVVIVFVVAPIGVRIFGEILGVNPSTPTEKSVMEGETSFAGKLRKLSDGTTSEELTLEIQKGYVLFSFNKNPQYLKYDRAWYRGSKTLNKPAQCLGQTCICLCKNWGCEKERPQCSYFTKLDAIVVKNFNDNKGKEAENPERKINDKDGHWLAVGGPLTKSFKLTKEGNEVKMSEN